MYFEHLKWGKNINVAHQFNIHTVNCNQMPSVVLANIQLRNTDRRFSVQLNALAEFRIKSVMAPFTEYKCVCISLPCMVKHAVANIQIHNILLICFEVSSDSTATDTT